MRINELIVESQQIDELSLAGALGSAAKGAANVVGGVKGAWAGAKDVYNQQSGRVANVAQRRVQKAGGYKAAPTGTAPATTAPATPAPVGATPAATTPTPTTAPTATAPTATAPTTAPAVTAPSTATPAATAPTTAPAATTGRASSQQVRKEIDATVGNVQQVRSRDRQKLVQYAQQKLASVKESSGFRSNFLGIEI